MKIKLFNSLRDSSFPQYNLDAWVNTRVYNGLYENSNQSSELFVKVESKDPLNAFTFFLKLQQLNDKNGFPDDAILLSEDLKHLDWTLENNIEVTVEPVRLNELPVAEVVTIKLREDEVANWSEDEEKFSINVFLSQNSIAYKQQKAWIKPSTKKSRIGTVIDIKSTSKNLKSLPYVVHNTTKVVLQGLPELKQKVIDFSKIGGLNSLITKLREIIQVPLQFPELLSRYDIRPPKGLILYGPPGNGKTMIARAVSHSMGAKFISIEGPELLSKYVGVAEQKLREKFEEADTQGNCVIFIDEIDAIAASRDYTTAEHQISLVATLLTLMDGLRVNQKVFVLAATNRLHAVDPALRRPGRFDLEFEVPLPNKEARFDILTKYVDLNNNGIIQPEIDNRYLERLSEITNGYSGADLFSLYREAAMNSIREDMLFDDKTGKINLKSKPEDIKLRKADFELSLRAITPTSMRGIDSKRASVLWEDVIGLNEIRSDLEKIILLRNNDAINLYQRYSFYNILCRGKPGSGKSTIIESLAHKFNYEILRLDFLNLQALEIGNCFTEIESLFTKAKQIAPSIVNIANLVSIEQSKVIMLKILNEINQLNPNYRVLIIAETDFNDSPEFILGFKGFGKVMVFPEKQTEETLIKIYEKFKVTHLQPINEFVRENRGKGIGQIISEIKEQQILNP